MRLPGGRRGGLSLSLQGQLGAAKARTEGPAGAGRGPCAFTAEGWPGGVATPSPPGLVARRGLCLPKLLLVVEKKKKKRCLPNTRSCCHTPARGLCQAQRRGLRPRSGALPSTARSLGTRGCSLLHQGLGVAVTGWSFWSFGSRVGVCPFSRSRARCCSQK